MSNLDVHFSSKKMDWGTPQNFFNELNERFNFTLDPCASHENHKCEKYFTVEENGLKQSWQGHTVFMNPPYGREIGKWMEKAYGEWLRGDCTIVCLVPARTDTKWFHENVYSYMNSELIKQLDYVHKSHIEVEFIKGRLKFEGAKYPAPFPSMLVIYRKWR